MEENKFATYKKMRADFYNKFKNNCVPILQKFDAERKSTISTFIIFMMISVVMSFVFLWCAKINLQDSLYVSVPYIATFIGMIFAGVALYSKFFENKIKKQIMPIVCNCFENLRWIEKPIINHYFYAQLGLINGTYNRTNEDDAFEGSFRGIPLKIEEIEYSEVTKTQNKKEGDIEHTRIIFKGAIVTLQMNKNFTGHTLVRPDSLIKSAGVSGLRHTTLEDVKFEKQYDVFTNDEVEARYLLTPTFMERLTGIKNVFKAQKISCVFYQNKFILALDTRRDLFKLGSLFKKADDTKQFFQMYEEIESILKLIDHFKLDQKIGL